MAQVQVEQKLPPDMREATPEEIQYQKNLKLMKTRVRNALEDAKEIVLNILSMETQDLINLFAESVNNKAEIKRLQDLLTKNNIDFEKKQNRAQRRAVEKETKKSKNRK